MGMTFIHNTMLMLMGSWCELRKITINEDETHATFTITRRGSTQSYLASNKLLLLDRKGSATVCESAAAHAHQPHITPV
jgi:hypothetical protein